MKRFISVLAAAVLAATAHDALPADAVGVHDIVVFAPERATDITATLWYPASDGGRPVLVGDNGVFEGTPALRDAPVAGTSLPVILLSHGGLRAAPDLDSWIASELAAAGYVVVSVHPPRLMPGDAAKAPAEMWLRPADLSAALTALGNDPVLASRIDAGSAGVLGLLLGGTSALALAGAKIDAQRFTASCDDVVGNPDCAWFAREGVDLHSVDAVQLGRSNLDPRIGSVVAVETELAGVVAPASLAAIAVPVQIVELGDGSGAALRGDDIPEARVDTVAEATPFDAFNPCKPAGLAILREEEGDELLCTDGLLPRKAVHARLSAMIRDTFDREFTRRR
jgi:predicted dienelactone hydrolase